MTSAALLDLIRCPDCGGPIARNGTRLYCPASNRTFVQSHGYLDLRPAVEFAEKTKYLDQALHADERHAHVAPPLLGSKIRHDMLRRLLDPGAGDRVIDLGCGSGRSMVWHAETGAAITGLDISPFFSADAIARCDLILGDLRRAPLNDAVFTKAWSLDVLEHLSPEALRDVLAEAGRVLVPGGAFFVYSHVRKNGPLALGVRLVNRLSGLLHRIGLVDLRQERLRKSDHLNPLADHDELGRAMAAAGFSLERVVYYTPIIGAFVENILVRMAERALAKRAPATRAATGAATADSPDATEAAAAASVKHARAAGQAMVARRGFTYRVLVMLSALMKLDIILFGRFKSGPFFALARKNSSGTKLVRTEDKR